MSKTDKVLKQLTPKVTKDVAGEMILPNLSGDHARGIKRNTPVNSYDLVNKSYVDTQISSVHVPVTVTDTTSVNLTLNGQDVKADVLPAGVDHDALLNFVSNEHIDWTNASDILKTSNYIQAGASNSSEALLGLGADTAGHEGVSLHHDGVEGWIKSVDAGTAWHDLNIQCNNLSLWLNGSADEIVFTSNGYVTITSANPRFIATSTSGNAELNLNPSGQTGWAMYADSSSGDLNFYQGGNKITFENSTGRIGVGTTSPACSLDVAGAIRGGTTTLSAAGPTDNLDVSGVNVVFLDATSNSVTLGGMTGGVSGQVLHLVVKVPSGGGDSIKLEHNEATGNQDIFLTSGADESLAASYGGWILVCDGSNWYDCS